MDGLGLVANPYIIGNPVHGDMFVGREDVLRRLEELWGQEGPRSSVVLYGHRRMGKTSVLQNLSGRFGSQTLVVDFSMQRLGRIRQDGELLFNLALRLYDVWHARGYDNVVEPIEQDFMGNYAYTAFDRFLAKLGQVRGNHRFIITIDEFERIEEHIDKGRLDSHALGHWRGIFQTYPWLIAIFAGLHTLEEMRHDYWHPFYGSVASIEVSFLSREWSHRLITQPKPNFPLEYDAKAVEQIISLTCGQPYLLQLIAHNLVTRFNRQTVGEGKQRETQFIVDDIEAVIDSSEFYRDANAYFNGVWARAATSQPAGQNAILNALSRSPLSLNELATETQLSLDNLRGALSTLRRHDVIVQQNEKYTYTVELMRRWVVQRLMRD